MTRWIRARVTAIDANRKTHVFTDVGPVEMRDIKRRYPKATIETPNDWGRYASPRNEGDVMERELIEKIMGVTYESHKRMSGKDTA